MRDYIKLGLTLLIICGVAAGTLALINSATAPVIAENKKQASYASYFKALGDQVDDFQELEEEELNKIKGSYANVKSILKATKGGELVGHVITATSNGYGGEMENAIIIGKDGSILAYRNLSNSESPGFGNVIDQESFYSRFNGKSVANNKELVLSSGGGENEIEAISGSTVTSKAVIKGLNEAVGAYKEFLENN